VPKVTWEETTRRFASHELHGYYGSLAHMLGSTRYTHYFCEAFRQSGDDFLAFMSYQGYKVLNYQTFRDRLNANRQLADGDSILGIHDGYMMQECAEILEKCPTHFTAHLMTCTTHSPWAIPPSFGPHFQEPNLNTFAYLDHSIEAFVKRIDQNPALREKTLIIVLGDHTSITFGKNQMERLRIPLIFYAPGLPRMENTNAIFASQIDVLPTILGLMPGDHLYTGMGRNLLDRSTPFTGIVSGTRDTEFYITENWLLQFHPFQGARQLFAISNGTAAPDNLAESQPELAKSLYQKYLARIELARRLSLDNRICPQDLSQQPRL
jgi:phosphoglycerol transferase MdoB-like AlkP superfamily enzyme